MKIILIITFLFSLYSCASFKNPRQIKQAEYDGLKYESLKRYDNIRLGNSIKLQDPLALCHNQDFEKANEIFKSELDSKINNYLYWNKISTCYILKKEYTQARNFLNLALGRAKTNAQKSMILNNIGVVLLEGKKYHEAKDYFKKSIELSKNSLTPKYNLTQIYLKFGLYGKAQSELMFLLNKNAKDVDFLNSKAYLELMQNNYKNALVYFNRIPKEYRTRDDIATNMAMTYLMLGLYKNAESSIGSADKKDHYYISKQLEISKKLKKKAER
jgi:tetratricopeptide (TPR) repeat protein